MRSALFASGAPERAEFLIYNLGEGRGAPCRCTSSLALARDSGSRVMMLYAQRVDLGAVGRGGGAP